MTIDGNSSSIDSSRSQDSNRYIPSTSLGQNNFHPRVLQRQIPTSTARGTANLGAANFNIDSSTGSMNVSNGEYNFLRIDKQGLFLNDGVNDRLGMTEDGFNVTKEGYDVRNLATIPEDALIFSTNFDFFKIIFSGTIDVVKPANTATAGTTVTIGSPNNTAYFILAYIFDEGANFYVPLPYNAINSTSGVTEVLTTFTNVVSPNNDNNISFYVTTPNTGTNTFYSAEFTQSVRYFVLANTFQF